MTAAALPSWRPGAARDAVVALLEQSRELPVERRVAVFDNDGTLWCERPTYAQYDFFEVALSRAAAADPTVRERPELAAVLDADQAAIDALGLERIARALAGLFEGRTPEAFTEEVRGFFATARHRTLGLPLAGTVYLPMLELLDALRHHEFTVCIATGGGTEFVRAISQAVYGVPPEAVVGTLIEYDLQRGHDGAPVLVRTGAIHGAANEGPAKVTHIQRQLGRRPILAAGNSGGDREMLEWAAAGDGPTLALLVDHDDDVREQRYVSSAGTFTETEPITAVGERLGWTVVSMARDWATVFPPH